MKYYPAYIKQEDKNGVVYDSFVDQITGIETPLMHWRVLPRKVDSASPSIIILEYPEKHKHIHYYQDKNKRVRAHITDERKRRDRHIPFEITFNELQKQLIRKKVLRV